MSQRISERGPRARPRLFLVTFLLLSLAGTAAVAAAAESSATAITQLGLNNFLVDLHTNHRLTYAIVVTAGTALLGIILSRVMGWLLRVVRIDRPR